MLGNFRSTESLYLNIAKETGEHSEPRDPDFTEEPQKPHEPSVLSGEHSSKFVLAMPEKWPNLSFRIVKK
jgi:hypothetical protein